MATPAMWETSRTWGSSEGAMERSTRALQRTKSKDQMGWIWTLHGEFNKLFKCPENMDISPNSTSRGHW